MSPCPNCKNPMEHVGVRIPWSPRAPIQVEHACQTWGCPMRLEIVREDTRDLTGLLEKVLGARGYGILVPSEDGRTFSSRLPASAPDAQVLQPGDMTRRDLQDVVRGMRAERVTEIRTPDPDPWEAPRPAPPESPAPAGDAAPSLRVEPVDWPHGNPYVPDLSGTGAVPSVTVSVNRVPTSPMHQDGDLPSCSTGWCGVPGHRGRPA